MALAAASTTTTTTTTTTQTSSESAMSMREQSELVHRYALELGPALRYSSAARAALSLSAQHFFQLNRAALACLLLGCNALALRTLLVARELALASTAALARLAWSAWDSKPGRRLRKKLEFELFVLILGCGNGFCLVLFWPGWFLIGLAYLVFLIWSWAG